jgi:GDP-L-fucose synthase
MTTTQKKMTPSAKVYIAGHTGLVGSAIVRRLKAAGYPDDDIITRRSSQLDLTRQADVEAFFEAEAPDVVILAAAKVGGILANDTYRGEFIRDNLLIQTHVIDAARRSGVERLLFLGSSCIYPRNCPQPMHEDHLLTGPLEPTNEPYAIAKIAGIKMCEAFNAQYGTRFLSVMPTNLYGPGDNFDLETSHVLPAFIHKFHRAKENGDDEVVMWGTGSPKREFLHVDDLADACVYLLEETDETELTNIGVGRDISIRELAELVAEVVRFDGEIVNDTSKPDGTPRKLLDVSRLNELGWQAKVELREGIARTYDWFVANWDD